MRKKVLAAILFGWAPFLVVSCGAPVAQEVKKTGLMLCIKGYTDIGISPDNALKECNKKTLAECVQLTLQGKFTAKAIKETSEGYLIDLGSNEQRWLEGRAWKELGCKAYSEGPYKRQSDLQQRGLFAGFSPGRSYEWFRQGHCSTPVLTLEQPLSMEEAKMKCELGMENPYAPTTSSPAKVRELPNKL